MGAAGPEVPKTPEPAKTALDVAGRIEGVLAGCHGQLNRIAPQGDESDKAVTEGLEAALDRIEATTTDLRERLSNVANRVGVL